MADRRRRPRRPRVIVFAGPTLPRDPDPAWRRLLAGCDLRPPAQRGDVLDALAARPDVIVLIDGYYYTVPAVTHKELLYALDAGVRVLGAASLGALRAAELAPLGMTGVGRVFDWYRSGRIDGDDEVAILHGPPEQGYRAITMALVELRHALETLAEGNPALASEAAARLVARVKELPFTARHPAAIAELSRRTLGEEAAAALGRRLFAVSVKEADARQALELALASPPTTAGARRQDCGGFLMFYKELYLRDPGGSDTLHGAWRLAQTLHPGAAGFVRDVRRRALLAAAALRAGLEPASTRRLTAGLERLHRRAFGRHLFPAPEYAEEARAAALAREACRRLGGMRGALEDLGRRFGVERGHDSEEALLALVAHPDLTPGWWLTRAFSFTPAFAFAREAAARAAEVHACFERWADGSRISRTDLRRLAARFWNCQPEDVEAEGRRRGLFESPNLAGGLWGALERLAAAESLPRPINAYPDARRAFLARPLSPPPGLSQPAPRLRGAEKKGAETDDRILVHHSGSESGAERARRGRPSP